MNSYLPIVLQLLVTQQFPCLIFHWQVVFTARSHKLYKKIYWGSFQYFVANPWALMTCLTLLCIESIRVWTISSGIFLPLLTNHSLQVRKSFWWRASLLIAFFRTIHKYSIGLRSGLCAGHSRDSRQWLFFQDCYFVTLSSCKIVALRLRCLSATRGRKCTSSNVTITKST